MRYRAAPVLAAGLSLVLLAGWAATSAGAMPPALPPMLADGGFDSAVQGLPSAWECGPDAKPRRINPPAGADFIHLLPLTSPEVPAVIRKGPGSDRPSPAPVTPSIEALPAPGPTRGSRPTHPTSAPGADFIHTHAATVAPSGPAIPGAAAQVTPGSSATPPVPGGPVVPPNRILGELWGMPTTHTRGECFQTVPVRPGATYTLTAKVRGGQAFLGSDHNVVSAPPSTGWTTLSTSFTTTADARTVRVYLHGWYGGKVYQADDVVLHGPPSNVQVPAVPFGLTVDRQTSGTARLRWAEVPGAGHYVVFRDGVAVGSAATNSATVQPSAALPTLFTVMAINHAGASAQSKPVSVEPAVQHSEPPDAPVIQHVRPWQNSGGAGLAVSVGPAERSTDGYAVYLDGAPAGWSLEPRIFVPAPAGPHVVEVTALNAAGESRRSAPVTAPAVPLP